MNSYLCWTTESIEQQWNLQWLHSCANSSQQFSRKPRKFVISQVSIGSQNKIIIQESCPIREQCTCMYGTTYSVSKAVKSVNAPGSILDRIFPSKIWLILYMDSHEKNYFNTLEWEFTHIFSRETNPENVPEASTASVGQWKFLQQ